MDKKNTMLLTVIAVATLLVAVVGATFAYFSVTGTNTTGTTVIEQEAEEVGTVTLTGGETLKMYVSAAEMASSLAGTANYYAVKDADFTAGTKNSATAVDATVATAQVTGSEAAVKYYCTFTLNVTKPTAGDTVMAPVAADGGVIFTLGGDATMAGVTSGTEIAWTSLADSYKVNFTMTGAAGNPATDLIKVASVLHNTTDGTQNTRLANKSYDLSFSLAADSFVCDTAALQ